MHHGRCRGRWRRAQVASYRSSPALPSYLARVELRHDSTPNRARGHLDSNAVQMGLEEHHLVVIGLQIQNYDSSLSIASNCHCLGS